MINEEFDEEGLPEPETEETAEEYAAKSDAPEPERPAGSWSRNIIGTEVWFRPVSRAQGAGLRRFYTATVKELDTCETDEEAVRISQEFYDLVHDLIDTLFLDPADQKVMNRALVQGALSQEGLLSIVFRGPDSGKPEPDDDAEPVSAPKPAKAANPARVKKTANAKRTQR